MSVDIEAESYRGVLNYGVKPTVTGENAPVAEVHILGFNQNIYNKPIKINLLQWIREEKNSARSKN